VLSLGRLLPLRVVRPTSRALDVSSARKERSDFWNYEPNAKVADSSPGVAPQDLAKLFAGSEPGIETNYAQVVSPDIVDLLVAKNGALDRSLVDAVGANSGRVEVSTIDSDTEIERPQVGLGLAILLAVGVEMAMRVAHVRPFAH
jgi:hypothetical protein